MESAGSEKEPLWISVQAELRCFASLVPLLQAEWMLPWCERVFSYDSSKFGWGVTSSIWPRERAAASGRLRERGRFRLAPSGCSARLSALTADRQTGARTVQADGTLTSRGRRQRQPPSADHNSQAVE